MDPINYNIDVKSPLESVLQGYQGGAAIRNDQIQQEQMQQQQEQQLQMQRDLANLSANATPQAISQTILKYPQLSKQLKESYDIANSDQQQSRLNLASQVYGAINSGDNDLAKTYLQKQADASKNSGDQQGFASAQAMIHMIDLHPDSAKATAGLFLAANLGPEKFTSAYSGLNNEDRANTKAPLENQKLKEDITSEQYKRQLDALDIQIKQANSETDRGRLQLERDKLVQEQTQKTKDLQGSAQTNLDSVNIGIDTIDKILKHPLWESGLGVGSTIGKSLSLLPGTDNKDFDALLDTIKSQQFLNGIQSLKNASKTGASGLGALSETEGKKVESAIASLDRNQKPESLKTALGVIKNALQKSQRDIIGSGNLPKSGGGFVINVPSVGNVSEGDINKLLTQYPGTTRDQAIQYLKSIGGK